MSETPAPNGAGGNAPEPGGNGGKARWKRWRNSRWMAVLVVASLTLNVFVLGWAGASVISHAGPWMWHRDKDRHAALHEVWHDHRAAFVDLGDEASGRLRDVAVALRADPYDPAALAASIDSLEGTAQNLLRLGSGTAKDVAETLDERERRWAARRIERAARRMERWSRRRDD